MPPPDGRLLQRCRSRGLCLAAGTDRGRAAAGRRGGRAVHPRGGARRPARLRAMPFLRRDRRLALRSCASPAWPRTVRLDRLAALPPSQAGQRKQDDDRQPRSCGSSQPAAQVASRSSAGFWTRWRTEKLTAPLAELERAHRRPCFGAVALERRAGRDRMPGGAAARPRGRGRSGGAGAAADARSCRRSATRSQSAPADCSARAGGWLRSSITPGAAR